MTKTSDLQGGMTPGRRRAGDTPAATDPFTYLGSAVTLTGNQEHGTQSDGEIHGAYVLQWPPK